MKKENEKYEKIVNILRNSKPHMDSPGEIEREVMKRITESQHKGVSLYDVGEFLFGWIYIGWVRRSLITLSILLVMFFVWQQAVILKQINYLSKKTEMVGREIITDPGDVLEKKMMVYRFSGKLFPSRSITVSEKQMNQLLDSVNELQIKYKDLMNLIEENPELKGYIEKKLTEKNKVKNNL